MPGPFQVPRTNRGFEYRHDGKLITLFTFVWPLGWVMCRLVFYLQDVSTICSVLNLVAISIERFYAIVYPLQAKTSCTVTQAKKIILTTWILSILLAVPRIIIMVKVNSFNC